MELKGKKVIALGERDGVQSVAISKCVQSAGAKVVLEVTHCFVWTAAGALDLEGQEEIKRVVDTEGAENIVVVLGTPTPESTKLYAQTVIEGDPSWAGVLAGVAMHLPTYHILESEVKSLVDPKVYEETIGASEFALDGESICQAVREVRETNGVAA